MIAIPRAKYQKLFVESRSKTKLFDSFGKLTSLYKLMTKSETEREVAKLINTKKYKNFITRKKDLEKQGWTTDLLMCSAQTAIQIGDDIIDLKKFER